ncbi:MAG: hypothetical protein CVT64_11920 [Actinobacteria bacterium HGW-Actinobacteria-4]|nr:MAG: hypothetical protein CVT64_11920 [Actinobacteria bacterium HGW-Actinobacteria-4]
MSRVLLEEDEYGHVVCPRCQDPSGIHFDTVEVVTASGRSVSAVARGEDEATTVSMEALNERDSGRRYTVRIGWWCEHCEPSGGVLEIQQHKGQSLARMLTVARPDIDEF